MQFYTGEGVGGAYWSFDIMSCSQLESITYCYWQTTHRSSLGNRSNAMQCKPDQDQNKQTKIKHQTNGPTYWPLSVNSDSVDEAVVKMAVLSSAVGLVVSRLLMFCVQLKQHVKKHCLKTNMKYLWIWRFIFKPFFTFWNGQTFPRLLLELSFPVIPRFHVHLCSISCPPVSITLHLQNKTNVLN